MKGIVLAGGSGTRLHPATLGVCKQLLPVYDKPMFYYPLSVLMLAGIRDILLISTPGDTPAFRRILGDGSHLGLRVSYLVQPRPEGIAQAFVLGEEFIGDDPVALVLGDNIFYGHGFTGILQRARERAQTGLSTVFGYRVEDPSRYGVVELGSDMRAQSIEEKPDTPKSNLAVTGLYFYTNRVVEIARGLSPSPRGELEITDVNTGFLTRDELYVELLGRGFAWLDTGSHESLFHAGAYVEAVESRQGQKIGCIEEVAYRMGYIDADALVKLGESNKSDYGRYLIDVAQE